jgi:glucose/arabinose dehydrogenase
MRKLLSLVFLMLLSLPTAAQDDVVMQLDAAPDPTLYRLEEVFNGLERPIYLTHAGDGSGRIFVVEQGGRIWLYKGGERQQIPFLDIQSLVSRDHNERGLLGLAFHPNFAENGLFYVHYSGVQNGETVVARYEISPDNPDVANPESASIIFTHPQPAGNHNGGMIEFGDDGYLYIGLGDGGSAGDPQNRAQNQTELLGKILRLDVDSEAPYAIPQDNPVNTVNPLLAPEIWAWGLRNPWRFSFDRATHDLYIGDVGQNQWEEIDFEPADSSGGVNYGWRVFEATHSFSGEADPGGTVMPIAEYNHSEGCSVTGGYVYRGEMLPALQSVYFFGDVCTGTIWATYRDTEANWQTIPFINRTGLSISSFGEDEAGELYVVDISGRVLRLIAFE